MLLAAKPHTISSKTLRITPTVIIAPTMVRRRMIPGTPLVLGSMLMAIGTSGGVEMTLASRSNTVGLLEDGLPAYELADGVPATCARSFPSLSVAARSIEGVRASLVRTGSRDREVHGT